MTAVSSAKVTVAAVVRQQARAYRKPARRAFADFDRLNQNGAPTVFRVLGTVRTRDCRTRWYRVQLPMRPNGVTGFVRAGAVQVGRVHTRIVVDISERRLTFFRNGKRVLATPVAVGSTATPTPTGSLLREPAADPHGYLGPVWPRGDRHLGLLQRAHRLGAGWADRDPRHE